MQPSPAQRILVIGPSWVGDMVMAQCLFIALQQQFPACVIDVLAPAWSLPLLARMPQVRAGIAMPLGHGVLDIRTRWQLGRSLRGQYDAAYVLPNSLKSAFVPLFAGITQRIGWRGEFRYGWLNDCRVLNKESYPLMIERFVALAFDEHATLPAPLPWPVLQIDARERDAALHKFSLDAQTPVLALCPGAEFGEAKRWPERHYASVASDAITHGQQVWIFGSANDARVAENIIALLPEAQRSACMSLAGKTVLGEAIDLLSLASAVVTNDSGLMHIAAALNRTVIAVYGSSSPQFTPPLSHSAVIVRTGIACSPCFQRQCPLGHRDCLEKLEPAQVLTALREAVAGADA